MFSKYNIITIHLLDKWDVGCLLLVTVVQQICSIAGIFFYRFYKLHIGGITLVIMVESSLQFQESDWQTWFSKLKEHDSNFEM